MGDPHVLMIPFPAQGHVIPMMELALSLVKHGLKITFVNTEITHNQLVNPLVMKDMISDQIHLVSIPDGLETREERKIPGNLTESISRVMPRKLEELIRESNKLEGREITCLIADLSFGWAMEVAADMGIKRAAFVPAAAASQVLVFSIPRLIDEGIIDNNGIATKNQTIQLSPTMPAMNTADFVWARIGDSRVQKIMFELFLRNNRSAKLADWLISNSTHDLEPGAFALAPEILPIGPLLASNWLGDSTGNFWPEDSTCLEWLDQQPPCSVIYVAFGSFTVFSQTQFQELALGLELSNRPFLWVVRPDIANGESHAYPEGFLDRVAIRGKIVSWAPQQNILSHPSIAFFFSHCGWNSTIEGVSNGVPFLCWPYLADQFINQSYICNVWKIGLGFERDTKGVMTHGDIKGKVEQLVGDGNFKARALDLEEMIISSSKEGGSSYKNFNNFIEWIKA